MGWFKSWWDHDYRNYDLIVVVSLVFFLTAHFLTGLALHKEAEKTKADYESVAKTVEANPIAKWFLLLEHGKRLLRYALLPSFVFAAYFCIRRWSGELSVMFTSYYLFFLGLLNVVNDVSQYLGVLL